MNMRSTKLGLIWYIQQIPLSVLCLKKTHDTNFTYIPTNVFFSNYEGSEDVDQKTLFTWERIATLVYYNFLSRRITCLSETMYLLFFTHFYEPFTLRTMRYVELPHAVLVSVSLILIQTEACEWNHTFLRFSIIP